MRSAESRWFSAYQAYQRAQNPEWKAFWQGVMDHFRAKFN